MLQFQLEFRKILVRIREKKIIAVKKILKAYKMYRETLY